MPLSDEFWNENRYVLHAIDGHTKWHEVSKIRKKSKFAPIEWIKSIIRKINRVFDADVYIIRSYNRREYGNNLIEQYIEGDIILETSASETPEQNSVVERARGTLTAKACVIRTHAKLPKYLANKMYKTTAYILNQTLNKALKWRTSYEII